MFGSEIGAWRSSGGAPKAAAALGAALVAAVAGSAPASAQSSLERRIEQLENEIRDLKALKGAPPQMARSGNKRIVLAISGQVNRGILAAFNDDANNLFFVDNDNSSTRLRFAGRAKIDSDWEFYARIEVEFESNTSSSVNQLSKSSAPTLKERKMEIRIKHRQWGAIWIGQGDTASNGIAEKDLSGTAVAGYSNFDDASGPRFGTAFPSAPIATAPQIKAVFDNLDGLSRRDRVRIDSPKVFGFMVSASVADDYARDVALHYSGEPIKAVLRVVGGVGYFKTGTPGRSGVAGSISALHKPSGLSIGFAGGKITDIDNAPGREGWSFWYIKGGWQFRIFNFGKTAVSVDYGVHKDVRLNDEVAWGVGVQLVQKIDRAATELYIAFRHYSVDSPGAGPDFGDVQTILAGARLKF